MAGRPGTQPRLRPGGVLPAWLVTTWAGPPPTFAAALPEPGGGRSGNRDGDAGGRITGFGTGWDEPFPPPEAERGEVPAPSPARGAGGACGPPDSPTAITVRPASSAVTRPIPRSRIRSRRRPETSASTGA